MINLHKQGGSKALVLASIWTGLLHLILAILGTFILKRFPTSFAIGFLLGLLAVTANQNLILFGVFRGYPYGSPGTNQAFAGFAFCAFALMLFLGLLLYHFKYDLAIAPIDAKRGLGRSSTNMEESTTGGEPATAYQSYHSTPAASTDKSSP